MDMQHNREHAPAPRHSQAAPTVSGSLIDASGREVPITEEMIQSACLELEKRLVKPANKN